MKSSNDQGSEQSNYRHGDHSIQPMADPFTMRGMNGESTAPPAIPSRSNFVNQSMYHHPQMMGGYGTPYSSPFTAGAYNYPGYGYRYGNVENSMATGVEHATRNTFQSVESIIQAFSSVSMMLESTLFAVQNSIRAVASVADQMSNLRHHLQSSAVTFLSTLKHILRKVLVMLRMKAKSSQNDIWDESLKVTDHTSKHWPLVMFFAVAIGMPWLLWQLLLHIRQQSSRNEKWHEGIGEHYIAEGKFDFKAERNDELSFTRGSSLRVAPKSQQPLVKGWILVADDENKGLVPTNYISIKSKSYTSNDVLEEEYKRAENVSGS